ncbi:MAG: ligase-associated DNA damage response endonuclease PdeM [Nitrosospira sp.]
MPELISGPSIRCAGHMLQMLPQRALWWASEKTLLVADVHLGKGATFRALGQPLPRGSSSRDLQRLSALVAQLQAQRLVVLGDFWHSRHGITPALFHGLRQWRHQHTQLQVILVRGNHDRAISKGNIPASLGIEIVDEPFPLAPGLYACHEPPLEVPGLPPPNNNSTANVPPTSVSTNAPDPFYLAGHLHPAVRLMGKGHDSARLPCFVWQEGQLVLPAFGSLTGHLTLDLGSLQRSGAKAGIVAPDTIWLV